MCWFCLCKDNTLGLCHVSVTVSAPQSPETPGATSANAIKDPRWAVVSLFLFHAFNSRLYPVIPWQDIIALITKSMIAPAFIVRVAV